MSISEDTKKLIEYLKQKHPEIFRELIFTQDGVYITVEGIELFKKHVNFKELLDLFDC